MTLWGITIIQQMVEPLPMPNEPGYKRCSALSHIYSICSSLPDHVVSLFNKWVGAKKWGKTMQKYLIKEPSWP